MADNTSTTSCASVAVAGPISMPRQVRTATSADSGSEAIRAFTCLVSGHASSGSTWASAGWLSFGENAGTGRPRTRRRRTGPVIYGGIERRLWLTPSFGRRSLAYVVVVRLNPPGYWARLVRAVEWALGLRQVTRPLSGNRRALHHRTPRFRGRRVRRCRRCFGP